MADFKKTYGEFTITTRTVWQGDVNYYATVEESYISGNDYDFACMGIFSGQDYYDNEFTAATPGIFKETPGIVSGYNPYHAMYFTIENNVLLLMIYNPNSQNAVMTTERNFYLPAGMWTSTGSHDCECFFASNIPIFETFEEAEAYCLNADDIARKAYLKSHAVNYYDPEYNKDTLDYYIENIYGRAQTVRNDATPLTEKSTRSMRFQANGIPVLYFNNDYSMTLVAPDVVASFSLTGPLSALDNVPQSSWVEKELMYTGLWYGSIARRLAALDEMLPDGEYMYGYSLNTNIYVFKDQQSAEEAMESGDYTGAENYDLVNGGDYPPPIFGDEETETQFGGGSDTSPFVQTYVLSRSALIQCAQAWYSTDPATLADILTGLSMYGDKPYESIAGITLYPFDVNRILVTSPQTYIYFGTYKLDMGGVQLNKALSLASNAYLDCGTIYLPELQHNYRDFAPYTQIDVWLPYIGWQRIDSALLLNKRVHVRYYVDIHTRACCACILANDVLVGTYNGTIGVGLPVSSSDYQGYANAVTNTIVQSGGNAIMSAGKAIGAAATGNYLAALASVGAAGVATASGLYQLEKLGAPADHANTRGNFTSCIGTYMPQTVLFRYIVHDALEPSNYGDMCGRPSSASGLVNSFSGYLACKQVKLNTTGMLDNEAAEIYNLLKSGIYI